MIDIGGGDARRQALLDLLATDHCVRVVVALLDLNENYLANLSDKLYDGQVNISADSDVSRSSSLQLFDPDAMITLDTFNPMDGALYTDRMISITYCVWQWGWTKSIDVPLFRGPITKVSRDDYFVNVECMGKEILAKNVLWNAFNYGVGYNKTAFVRDIMGRGAGETKFDLQISTGKFTKARSYKKLENPWEEATEVANGTGQYLFYDGRGVLRMRSYPKTVGFTFRSGDGGMLRTKPQIVYDMDNFYNGVYVKGNTSSIEASVWAPEDHPFNHNRLARNGVPFRKPMVIEDSEITTVAAAKTRAQGALTEAITQGIDLQTTALIMPLIEEGDMIEIELKGQYKVPIRLKSVSIPLLGTDMTLGQTKNITLKKRVA